MLVQVYLKIFKLSHFIDVGTDVACYDSSNTIDKANENGDIPMKRRRVNILCRKEINGALNRHITNKLFESRIMEHPQQALDRTTFNQETRLSNDKRNVQIEKK
jgi:hypothetical protein